MTSFSTESRPGAVVVRPSGRLDLVSAGDLRSVLAEAHLAGPVKVVVDLAEVTVMDSSGLGALVAGLRAARQAGGDLRIARPSEQALLVLDLTRMNQVLRPYPSVEEALG